MRCQLHKDLDRHTKKAESLVQQGGLPINHPLVEQENRRMRVILNLMKHRGHALGYDCPDEDEE